MTSFIEHYPQVLEHVAPFLHMKDRTKIRYCVSNSLSHDSEGYDTRYEKVLKLNTCLLQIMECPGCDRWVKYSEARWYECHDCGVDCCQHCKHHCLM